jgi:hypothetical protein
MTDGFDRRSAPYDFRAVRRMSDRDLARFVADRNRDPVDMTFIDAEWQRRQARGIPDVALAAIALLVSAGALGLGAYAALVRPAPAAREMAVAAAGTASPPRLAYNVDEPPFPQRGAAR